MTLLLVTSAAIVIGMDGRAQEPPSAEDATLLVTTLIDPDAPWEERAAAEASLISCTDAQVLEDIWTHLEGPVPFGQQFEFIDGQLVSTDEPAEMHPQHVVALVPGGGSAEGDRGSPVGAQIVYARLRVWQALTRSAGTAAERSAILLDLLSRDQGEFAKIMVLRACMRNWSVDLGQAVEGIGLDVQENCRVRREAFRLLMVQQRDSFLKLVDAVWVERHTACADDLSRHLTQTRAGMEPMYDPRVMLLRVDTFTRYLQEGNSVGASRVAMELNAYGKLGIDQAASPEAPEGSDAWYARLNQEMEVWISDNIARLELEAANAKAPSGS